MQTYKHIKSKVWNLTKPDEVKKKTYSPAKGSKYQFDFPRSLCETLTDTASVHFHYCPEF